MAVDAVPKQKTTNAMPSRDPRRRPSGRCGSGTPWSRVHPAGPGARSVASGNHEQTTARRLRPDDPRSCRPSCPSSACWRWRVSSPSASRIWGSSVPVIVHHSLPGRSSLGGLRGAVVAVRFVPREWTTRIVLVGRSWSASRRSSARRTPVPTLPGTPGTASCNTPAFHRTPTRRSRTRWPTCARLAVPDKIDGTCKPLEPRMRGLGDGADGHCVAINRPDVTTIYPPMAQLWFAGVRAFVPATAQYMPFQVAGLLVSLGVTIVCRGAPSASAARPGGPRCGPGRRSSRPRRSRTRTSTSSVPPSPRRASCSSPSVGRSGAGSPRCGDATKLIPAIVYPPPARPVAVLVGGPRRHRHVRAALRALRAHDRREGPRYLPGYLSEEGYEDGSRFALVSSVIKGDAATIVVGLVVLLAAVVSGASRTPHGRGPPRCS